MMTLEPNDFPKTKKAKLEVDFSETTLIEDSDSLPELDTVQDAPQVPTKSPSCKRFYKGDWSNATFFEFYDRVLGAKIMDHYGKLLGIQTKNFLESLDDHSTQDFHVLEVAAGTGRFTKHIYSNVVASSSPRAKHFKLTATDMSAAAIVRAKMVLPAEVTKNSTLLGDIDMADMPEIEDHSVDVIVCGFGLMFPPDKAQVVREFQRVLRPGGKVLSTMFHRNMWFEAAQKECITQFGSKSPILRGALALGDPSSVVTPFQVANMTPNLECVDYTFEADKLDTEELLYNACILLEEFNQDSYGRQASMLETITDTIHKQAPRASDTNPNMANFSVKVWILECTQPQDLSVSVEETKTVDVVESTGLDLDAFKTFVNASLDEKKVLCESAKQTFLTQHGDSYDEAAVDAFRAKEFARLDQDKETYLDFVGGSLPPLSVLQNSFASYQNGAAGNPHSAGKKSRQTLDKLRKQVLRFFNCQDNDDYEMILTANASNAISIVAECFGFQQGSTFVLTKDNHTSIHGIRQSVADKGGNTRYVTLTSDLTIWETSMNRALHQADPNKPNLLAYPAQSNATGVKHDLEWVSKAQEKGFHVLLDAAAYVPTTPLDLSRSAACRPDFIPISFYKIFGYPTGLGCLLAKKSALKQLNPAGMRSGSVCYFSGPWSPKERLMRYEDERRFENGTPNYMAYESTSHGFEFVQEVGIDVIGGRARALARWLESSLSELHHDNGARVVRIYEPKDKTVQKGATIMFNFFDQKQSLFPYQAVSAIAAEHGVSLRTGCFCNLGVVQQATYEEAGSEHCELDRKGEKISTCSQFQSEILSAGHCGAIRLSFGLGSTFNDAYAFYLFGRGLLNRSATDLAVEGSSSR